jgi:transposase
MKPTPRPELTPDQRLELERCVRAATSTKRLVERAQIILSAAEGLPDSQVAAELGCSRAKVACWVERFRTGGIAVLGRDLPRSGRRRTVMTPEKVQQVVDATRLTRPPAGTHWSIRSLAKAQGISATSVQRVWKAHRLRPHRSETWKLSLDPDFADKLADVVGLYLNPPEKAVVLSIDEKSQIQALERTQPILPLREGLPERQTHDYRRHGTTSLFTALHVLEGKVEGECYERHTHAEFLDFLQKVHGGVPEGLALHVILDNYATHKHPKVKAWVTEHPDVHLHFVPTGCSWANLVERFFSELTTRRIRRDSFRSVTELEAAITEFITHHNEHGKPYVWTKTFDEIVRSINRCYRN